MADPLCHPITGEPIALGPGEQLQRIAWAGAPVVVVTRPGPAGELVYRLARPSCQAWNPADGLRFEPWPPAPLMADQRPATACPPPGTF